MSKNVIEKSEDMLGKIDDRYDMTMPEIQEIMEYYNIYTMESGSVSVICLI